MLIAHQAVSNKIESVKRSIGNTITIRPAGYVGGSQANNALTTSQLDKVKALSHITKLTESLDSNLTTIGAGQLPAGASSGNTTTLKSPIKLNVNGNSATADGIAIGSSGGLPKDFSLPISVLGTNDPTAIGEANAKITITNGKTLDGSKDSNDALISDSMASKNNLKVGSTFTAFKTTLTVVGTFKSGTQAGDNFVILSLPSLERLSGNAHAVTAAVADVDSVSNIGSTTDTVKKVLGSSADVTSSEQTVQNAIKPLQDIQNVSLYSLIGAVIAGSVIILLTMIMIVRERKREIGVIKALGSSNLRVMFQFMVEALTLTILGAVIGLIIGLAGGSPVTKTLVTNSTTTTTSTPQIPTTPSGNTARTISLDSNIAGIRNIQTEIGWSIILYGLGAAVFIAIAGSALASFFIAKIKPAEVLRSE
jgi:putative ABC transport system permease protein